MLKITVKAHSKVLHVDPVNQTLDGKEMLLDIIPIRAGSFHVLHNNRSYLAEVLSVDASSKKFTLRINGNVYETELKDQYDELLHKLGMDKVVSQGENILKAPMPGLVLDVRVKEGDSVAKGDTLVVLEAMKMENSLKSPGAGIVKKVFAQKGNKVEKNQPLIELGE